MRAGYSAKGAKQAAARLLTNVDLKALDRKRKSSQDSAKRNDVTSWIESFGQYETLRLCDEKRGTADKDRIHAQVVISLTPHCRHHAGDKQLRYHER